MAWDVKLDWGEEDELTVEEMNRIEGNLNHILNENATFTGDKTFTGTITVSGLTTLTNLLVNTLATITTANITTSNVTTANLTTANITTANVTTENVTTVNASGTITCDTFVQATPGTYYINDVEINSTGYIVGSVYA